MVDPLRCKFASKPHIGRKSRRLPVGWRTLESRLLIFMPHVASGGFARKTTKCAMLKLTTKPARIDASFAANAGMKYDSRTSTVVDAMTPRIPDATKVK